MRAVYQGAVLAESDNTVVVEGNHYFPADSVTLGPVQPSTTSHHLPVEGRGVLLLRHGR